jgi:Raf kinase inhibitor-like YbhB/YbcL family protein
MKLRTVLLLALLPSTPAMAFDVHSSDVQDGKPIPAAQVANVFGCSGENVSPEIAWRDVPPGTQSLVVTMFDPDAPTGSGFWHWVVFDIPASATGLPRGAGSEGGKGLPAGAVQSRNDAGAAAYLGACPPVGSVHHYVITVKALKVKTLGLDANASGALVGFASNATKLSEATITSTSAR